MRANPEGAAVEMNSAARRRRHAAFRYGRLVTWLVSGALLIAFASYVLLPVGLAWYIPHLAAQYGIHVDVGRVRVEPFTSVLGFSDVRVATSGDSSIEWSNIESRVDLAELLSGRLVLDSFHLSDAKLHAGDPGMDAAGMLPDLPAALSEDVSVGELVIDGVELASMSEALGHPVAIDLLRISSLDEVFRPEGAEVEASFTVGKGRSRLQGQLGLDDSGWILNAGEIVANDVPVDGLPALLGAGASWRGRLDGAGPVRLVYSPVNGAFSATTGGRWAIEGMELGTARVAISGARADWDGAAFLMFSGDAVDALSVDGEVAVRGLRIDVADMLEVEAPELVLQIDASQAPETRLSMESDIPVVRLSGKGGAFEAVDAEATNLASRATLTIAHDIGVEIDWLRSSALAVKPRAGQSVDIDRIELGRVVVGAGTDVVSAATGSAERVDWRGFTGPRSTGTASRLAIEGIERQGNGEFRLARATTEAVENRSGDSVLRLRDVALESATFSPDGTLAIDEARILDAWLASESSTLVVERMSLDGVQRDEASTVSIASGRAGVVDHTLAGTRAVVGEALEVTGGNVSGRAWEAKSIRLGSLDIETGDASYALKDLALADATGEGERANAGSARLGALDLDLVGHRVVAEDLAADSPAWAAGAGSAEAIEAVSVTLDTLQRHRWRSGGWRLTGVERMTSGRTSAERASAETLVLDATDDSTTGAQGVEFDELVFENESAMHAAGAFAERTYFRARGGSGIDVAGLRAHTVDWNGETLSAERGVAPLMSVAAPPAHASFDTIAFTSARLGVRGVRELGTLTSASGRGNVERVLEWSMRASALSGYHAPASGGTTLDSVETHDFALTDDASEAHFRADRVTARDTRVGASGEAAFTDVEVQGIAVGGAPGGARASAHTLRASPLTIGESALTIGALSLAGLEGAIGVSEGGDWVLPALPLRTGTAQSSFRVSIGEASTAERGSVIHVVDRTTEPEFSGSIDIASASLRGFDSEAVGVPARFAVDAAGDIFTALHADGVLTPTLTGTDLDVNATILGLSLHELSPYARLHLGRSVEGGIADVAIDATIRTSDLEGGVDFTSSEIVLGKVEPPAGATGLGGEGTDALDAALNSLADEQGRIELKLPLRGKLDAPGFDLDGIVARAFARAALETPVAPREAE